VSGKILSREKRRKIAGYVRTTGRVLLALLPIVLVVYGVRQYRFSQRAEPLRAQKDAGVGPHVDTPLFAVRRIPTLLSAPLATTQIKQKLTSLSALIPGGSCLGVLADGQVVGATNPDTAVIPASNMKVVTAAVALDVLGPDYTFTTKVFGKATDGVTEELTVVGGGDPMLATKKFREASKTFPYYVETPFTPIDEILKQLRAPPNDIRVVNGDLVGVGSRYEGDGSYGSWPKNQVSPIGGLVINDTRISYTDELYGTDPAKHAVEQLAANMRDARIIYNGGDPRSGPMPEDPGKELASVTSAPLKDIVAAMLTRSENTIAEMLFREIGKKVLNNGSFGGAAQAVTDTLTKWGVPMTGVVVNDGSGLDRGNKLTCQALISVLSHGGPSSALAAGLATPGHGTLDKEFLSSPVKDRLHAKTGTLNGVKSLSGFVSSTPEHSVTFAIVLNGANAAAQSEKLWSILGDAMASFPTPIDLAAFSPKPAVAG
jgi:serine-type D-Ala-D-Ala carboxypeptidase/endopeptidase (penicillin-binding protein 4)